MVIRDVFHTTLVHHRHQVSGSKMSILVEVISATATCYHHLVIPTRLQPSMATVLLSVCCCIGGIALRLSRRRLHKDESKAETAPFQD